MFQDTGCNLLRKMGQKVFLREENPMSQMKEGKEKVSLTFSSEDVLPIPPERMLSASPV
jgi:hypothetical protein